MLLLGEPQTLPILSIKVNLLPFYVIAPLLYLVFHFYVLMMLVLLARTAAPFERELRATLPHEADRELYRARVENALFLQLLVGMRAERSGANGRLLGLIALITIVLFPLATLILMQMMFLPYHSFGITWWHRILVVADLVLVMVMTRRFFSRTALNGPLSWQPSWLAELCLAAAVIWLLWEGRWTGEPGIGRDFARSELGPVLGLFPDRLKLNDETIVGEKTVDETKKEISSRGGDFVPTIKFDDRHLEAAQLSGADLRGVSLTGADMRAADLSSARLDGARLSDAQLQGANLSYVRLSGADLDLAQLQGAQLIYADLRSADLGGARLQGDDLRFAQLQGAKLRDTRLTGADIGFAQLQDADLSGAQLQGGDFRGGQLQGADLSNAQLQGANLRFAQLQGADLIGARLPGADLIDAQLQGANLGAAELQGADLSGAQLQGANLGSAEMADSTLDAAFVFRTNIADADLSTAFIRSVRVDPVKIGELRSIQPLRPADVDGWIADATQFAHEADNARIGVAHEADKARIGARFARLKPDFHDDDQEPTWPGIEEASRALDSEGAHHRQRLVVLLGDLACGRGGAPEVARALIRPHWPSSLILPALGEQLALVRDRMEEGRKTPEKCPGVAGFTEYDWRALEAINPAGTLPGATAAQP